MYIPQGEATLSKSELIVTGLMEDLLDEGRHVITDSWYTSSRLGSHLHENRTYLTGTIDKHRGIPKRLQEEKVAKKSSAFMRKGDILACKFEDRKPVYSLTTRYPARIVAKERGYHAGARKEIKLPLQIQKYNTYMGSVDKADQMLSPYAFQRKSMAWFKKLGLHFIDRMMFNSFIAYKNMNPDKNLVYLAYIKEVANELIKEYSEKGAIMIEKYNNRPSRSTNQRRGATRPTVNVAPQRVRRSPLQRPPPTPPTPAATRRGRRRRPATQTTPRPINVRRRLLDSPEPYSSPLQARQVVAHSPPISPLPASPPTSPLLASPPRPSGAVTRSRGHLRRRSSSRTSPGRNVRQRLQDSPPQPSEPSQSSSTPKAIHQRVRKPKKPGQTRQPCAVCRVCRAKKQIRKDTMYVCLVCPEIPGLCSPECFEIWHQEGELYTPTPPKRIARRRRASRQPEPAPSSVEAPVPSSAEAPSAVIESPAPSAVIEAPAPSVDVEPVSSVVQPGGSGIDSRRFYAAAKKLPDGSYALPLSSSESGMSFSDSSD